ncbi:hypothetical protein BSKO_04647 [Bryopsis sp. KO-2023]|nr:hypothetical protein BSKO_04647 [Bryopsis sp. KO-2023]
MAAKDSLDRFLQQDENRRSLSRPCSNAVNLPAFGYHTTGNGNGNAFTTLPAYGETSNPARGRDDGRQGGWSGGMEPTVGRQMGVSYVPPPHHAVYPVLSGVPNYYGEGMQPQPMQWVVPVQNTILPGRERGNGWGSGHNSRRNTPVVGELGHHHSQKQAHASKGEIQRVDVSPLPMKTAGNRSVYASSVNNTEAEMFGRKVDIKPYSRTHRCEKSTLMSKRTQPKVNVCFQPSRGTFAGKLIIQPPGGPSSLSLG